MRRTRSLLFGVAVICSMLLSSAQGGRPERKTYLRRLVDDSLASGLSTLEQLMTASIVSGTGSDAATAAKATAGGQENAARTAAAAAAKKDDDDDSTATTSTTASTATDDDSAAADDDSVATDDDDSTGGKKTSTSKKAKASPPPNLSVNVTQTDESPADWYDDDGSATMAVGDKAEAPASAGSTSGSAAGTANTGATSTSSTSSNTTLPNGRASLDTNNPHRAEMKRNNPDGIHNSTNDDDDVGYIHHNSTSNEDYVVGYDDDAPKTRTDAIVSVISKKSMKMSMSTREGYVAAFVVLVAAAGFGIYLATKRCRRMMKQQRRRSGYQTIE